jgi:ATP-dependent DNA ligase
MRLATSREERIREKSDCIILGYQVDRSGRLDTLILGAVHKKKLTYVGRVSPELAEEARSSLLAELIAIKSRRPFITIEAQATWVKPKFTCRVSYGEKMRNGQLREVKWDALLGSVKIDRR